MSLRNPWTPEGLFSSLIHNRPESGSESRFRRGRRMDENIAHADGRIASAGQGKATEDPRAAPGSAGSARHTRTGPARSHSHGVPEQSHADTGRGRGPRAGREGEHAPHPAPQASPGRPPHFLVLPELRPRLPWRALGRHPVQMRVARLFQCLGGFAGTSASTCSSLRRFPHLPESSQTFSHHSFTPTFPPALSDHESISCLCRSASSGRFMKNEPCNTWPLASGSSPGALVPGAIHGRRVRGLVASSG